MDRDAITFGLAAAGYLLLAKDSALRLRGRRWTWIGVATALVVGAHVALVWTWRFEGSLGSAWGKSPPAFVLFHAALLLILAAPWLSGTRHDHVTWAAFAVVSLGVLPAPLRYEEVAVLAVPLWAAAGGVAAVWWTTRRGPGDAKPRAVTRRP